MSVVSDAFESACAGDYQPLADLISQQAGQPVTPEWVEAALELAMPLILAAAPCKQGEWVTFCDIPPELQPIMLSLLLRVAVTPTGGIRTIQLGEFSQTWSDTGASLSVDERELISALAGCGSVRGGLISVRAVVDPPIPAIHAPADQGYERD